MSFVGRLSNRITLLAEKQPLVGVVIFGLVCIAGGIGSQLSLSEYREKVISVQRLSVEQAFRASEKGPVYAELIQPFDLNCQEAFKKIRYFYYPLWQENGVIKILALFDGQDGCESQKNVPIIGTIRRSISITQELTEIGYDTGRFDPEIRVLCTHCNADNAKVGIYLCFAFFFMGLAASIYYAIKWKKTKI